MAGTGSAGKRSSSTSAHECFGRRATSWPTGYVATSVAQIITRAGVSRETFYQQFESKQDCFIAALEGVIASLADTLDAGLAVRGSPLDRFDEALTRYLAALASDPARARVFLVEIYAAGDDVLSRRLHLQRQFVDGLLALFGGRSERARFRCEALVNATIGAVTARIINDDSGSIPTLRRPLRELRLNCFPTPPANCLAVEVLPHRSSIEMPPPGRRCLTPPAAESSAGTPAWTLLRGAHRTTCAVVRRMRTVRRRSVWPTFRSGASAEVAWLVVAGRSLLVNSAPRRCWRGDDAVEGGVDRLGDESVADGGVPVQ